jgi:SAM-dependent methyltransferase
LEPKPRHLGADYAAQFQDESVVRAYEHRPPYPAQLDSRLLELLGPGPIQLLDLGCGTGELARRIAPHVAAVTAIDQSASMIARARELPGGLHPRIEWKVGAVESYPFDRPYSAVLAAQSFHWFDWYRLVPRLLNVIPSRRLIVVDGRGYSRAPWWKEIARIIPSFSTNVHYEPYDGIEELTRRGLLVVHGDESLLGEEFQQDVDTYIESVHSRNGLSRDRMVPERAAEFDALVRQCLRPHVHGGLLTLHSACRITWGVFDAVG